MAVSLSVLRTGRALLPRNISSAPGTHFCSKLSKPQDLARLEGFNKLEKIIEFVGSGTRNVPACDVVLQLYMPYKETVR
jgi:hypothetical protein